MRLLDMARKRDRHWSEDAAAAADRRGGAAAAPPPHDPLEDPA
ncbi:hypothetical protein [Streptomyces sp. AS13]|nr:hypothetical protein [Streptomyces sp. AS13]